MREKARSFPDGEDTSCLCTSVTVNGKTSSPKPVFHPETGTYNDDPYTFRDKKRATAVTLFANRA